MSQKHYLKTFCALMTIGLIPALTSMTPGSRLTKEQCDPHPDPPDPVFHRRYRGIVGSLGYLVNLTRPDSVWSYSD